MLACALIWSAVQVASAVLWANGTLSGFVFLAFYSVTCISWVLLVQVKERQWK